MRLAGFAILCCVAGCEGGSTVAPDAAPDAVFDAGSCGTEGLVTGALVDFDSTTSQLRGVFDARFTVEGMPAKTTTTAPDGRFQLCAPIAPSITFDVDAPADYLDGKAYIELDALGARPLSFRAYTQARGSMLYAFDPARAHVLVFLAGDRNDLTLSRPHDPPLSGNDDDGDGVFAWMAGNVGRYVLFPNVDAAKPTVTLEGDLSGPHTIPVAAGRLTLVAIAFVYLP
jgi:hypothetical protein